MSFKGSKRGVHTVRSKHLTFPIEVCERMVEEAKKNDLKVSTYVSIVLEQHFKSLDSVNSLCGEGEGEGEGENGGSNAGR